MCRVGVQLTNGLTLTYLGICVAGSLVFALSLPSWSFAAQKIAFVVGINTYDNLPEHRQLKNPVNDAHGVSRTLRNLRFDVTEKHDLSRSEFYEAWQNLLDKIADEDTLLFFFSGHGVQIDGQNYLLPRSVPYIQYGRQAQLARESISVSELLQDLVSGDRTHPKVTVMILDACRDNPLIPSTIKGVEDLGGLATVEAPEGTFVMYSAANNQIALDRLSANDQTPYSVYTRALLPLMTRADLTIQQLAVTLRADVRRLTKDAGYVQRPPYYDGIDGRFCLPGCQRPESVVSVFPGSSLKAAGGSRVSRLSEMAPRMVRIPTGTFLMGSPTTEEGRHKDEGPQHKVTVSAFELGESEVTFAEWDRCVAARACRYLDDLGWGRDDHPVVNASWTDTQAYIRWLNRQLSLSGKNAFRLPTEAEWEYAAKGGGRQDVWAGTSNGKALKDYAVYKENSGGHTAEVRSKRPNGFDMYDMSGNVSEWVADCWHGSYSRAPDDGGEWLGANDGDCNRRVSRGGAWVSTQRVLRSAYRARFHPDHATVDTGFRLARTP